MSSAQLTRQDIENVIFYVLGNENRDRLLIEPTIYDYIGKPDSSLVGVVVCTDGNKSYVIDHIGVDDNRIEMLEVTTNDEA